jgi:hypothetical protein
MAETKKAILVHPSGNFSGNLLWSGSLLGALDAKLPEALERVRAFGYWASAFPEGDGVTFNAANRHDYDPGRALRDFSAAFDFLEIMEHELGRSIASTLADSSGGQMIRCRYLVPVNRLRLDGPVTYGRTTLHPAVNGDDILATDHAFYDYLADLPDVEMPGWAPTERTGGSAALFGHVLLEREIEMDVGLLHGASASVRGTEAMLRLLMEDADAALDPVRFAFCSFRKLEYLPVRPGWIEDTAHAYVIPSDRAFEDKHYLGVPSVLRVESNWLGLDLEHGSGIAEELTDYVDNTLTAEMDLAIRAALRALGRSFYLTDLEAAFLSLVYALDALCAPERLRGGHHRIWVAAAASGGNVARFEQLVASFDMHYGYRNAIVHAGESFPSLGVEGEAACDFMAGVLAQTINHFAGAGDSTRAAATAALGALITSSGYQLALQTLQVENVRLPIEEDRDFRRLLQA